MSISGVSASASMMRSFQPPSFKSIDADSSGGLTLDELTASAPGGASDTQAAARAESLFAAMDTDGSGTVSSDEKDAFDAQLAEQMQSMAFMTQQMAGSMPPSPPDDAALFAATDADGSGTVSLAEFSQSDAAEELSSEQLSELFSLFDTDGDGAITETESSQTLEQLRAELDAAMGAPAGGPSGAGGPPPGPPPDQSASAESEEEDQTAIDLLTTATSAYAASQSSTSLLDALTSIFDKAA